MSITDQIIEEIVKLRIDLNEYGCNIKDIQRFYSTRPGSDDRIKEAIRMVSLIMSENGKKDLNSYISEYYRIEVGIQEMQKHIRDHVSHAIHCYVLGILLNKIHLNNEVTGFEWKLACLFHDMAYPIQIAQDFLKEYNNKILEINRALSHEDYHEPIFKLQNEYLEKVEKQESIKYLQKQINSWKLEVDTEAEYKRVQAGDICHGIISSLLLLKLLDGMYKYNNPEGKDSDVEIGHIRFDRKIFNNDIRKACTAIFLHNLPLESLRGVKIHQKASVAHLLKLVDTLQEWERPNRKLPYGVVAENFRLEISEKISIYAKMEQYKVNSINETLKDFLGIENIMYYSE